MKKISIQITDSNVKFINDSKISFSKIVNYALDNLRLRDKTELINDIEKHIKKSVL